MQLLTHAQLPFLERRAVADTESGQEVAAVQGDRLLHPRGAAAAAAFFCGAAAAVATSGSGASGPTSGATA